MTASATAWDSYLMDCRQRVQHCAPLQAYGRVTRVAGLVMEAVGLRLPVGSACQIVVSADYLAEAEVVGFAGDRLYLMPLSNVHGLQPGLAVCAVPEIRPPLYEEPADSSGTVRMLGRKVPVGMSLLGRVVDSLGRPLDGGAEPMAAQAHPVDERTGGLNILPDDDTLAAPAPVDAPAPRKTRPAPAAKTRRAPAPALELKDRAERPEPAAPASTSSLLDTRVWLTPSCSSRARRARSSSCDCCTWRASRRSLFSATRCSLRLSARPLALMRAMPKPAMPAIHSSVVAMLRLASRSSCDSVAWMPSR